MNKTMFRGKMRQARGGFKMEWGRLTDNDQRMLDGKIDQMLGLFQERYGYTQERATEALNHYLHRHQKRQSMLPVKGTKGRWIIGATIGMVLLSVMGWFTFSKFFSTVEPMAPETGADESLEFMDELFEPEDFEAELFASETRLD